MEISATYTTQEKIAKDVTGTEAKKTILTNDAYAISDIIEQLLNKIEHLRVDLQ